MSSKLSSAVVCGLDPEGYRLTTLKPAGYLSSFLCDSSDGDGGRGTKQEVKQLIPLDCNHRRKMGLVWYWCFPKSKFA